MALLKRLWPLLFIMGCYDLDYGRQNAVPVVVIDSPLDAQTVESPVVITGTATDDEDGDLSGDMVWKSDDELIGVGAVISADLPDGEHIISGSVSDSTGAVVTARISITVSTKSTQ
jgi:hypothetical protein